MNKRLPNSLPARPTQPSAKEFSSKRRSVPTAAATPFKSARTASLARSKHVESGSFDPLFSEAPHVQSRQRRSSGRFTGVPEENCRANAERLGRGVRREVGRRADGRVNGGLGRGSATFAPGQRGVRCAARSAGGPTV